MNVYFRRVTEVDIPSLSRICLLTADAGKSAEHLHDHGELPGLLYAVPYIRFPTAFGFVVVHEGSDEVIGYIVGSTDTRAYEREAAETWWPLLQRRYPMNDARCTEADQIYLSHLHNPPIASPANISFSSAHIHINILQPYQGRGYGRRLIEKAVEYLKEQGLNRLWVGMDPRNESARRFYLKLGFRDILASPPGNMGLDFVDLK